jgi:hypothetical protein
MPFCFVSTQGAQGYMLLFTPKAAFLEDLMRIVTDRNSYTSETGSISVLPR